MHLFTDESGTGQDDVFLVAGVLSTARDAAELIKPVRKACRIAGELHGTHLNERQRAKAFRIISESGLVAATVCCVRAETHGGWALGAVAEDILWANLHGEAALALLQRHGGSCTGLTADTGKFTAAVREERRRDIESIVGTATRLSVDYQQSHSSHGLQIADVVANLTYRVLKGTATAEEADAHVAAVAAGTVVVHRAQLPALTPPWLVQQAS